MKRPMCLIGGVLAVATWGSFFFSAQRALLLSGAAALTGALLLVPAKGRHRLRALCAACLTGALALALHARYEWTRLAPFERAADAVVVAEGFVEDSYAGARTVYYTLRARFPENAELPDTVLRVRSYGDLELLPGDVVRCEVRLAPKEQPERGLRFAADSYVDAYLESAPALTGEGYALRRRVFALRRRVFALREHLRANVYAALERENADVVSAMVLGLRDNLPAEVYAAVNRAGTSHLLAISGLHLSIVAAIALRLAARLPVSRRGKALLSLLAVAGFAVLVGFSASIIRSLVMTATVFAANGFARRRGDALSALGFAAALISVLWPDWLLGRSFWLSAGATLGIILFSRRIADALHSCAQGRAKLYNKLVDAACEVVAVSLAASVFTLPLLVAFSGWISLIAPFANLLAAPFVPVVIGGGMLCAALGPAGPALRLVALATDVCTGMVLEISRIVGDLPFATAAVNQNWMLIWAGFVPLTLLALYRLRADKKLRVYSATLLVFAFCVGSLSQQLADRDRVELVLLESCDSAVLLREGEAVIVGVPRYFEVNRLLRYLEFREVRCIRAVVAADHGEQLGSGLLALADAYPVDCVIGPDDEYILAQLERALPGTPVYSGEGAVLEVLGGVPVEVIRPGGDVVIRAANNTVLKTGTEYAIIEDTRAYSIVLCPDGEVAMQGARGLEPTPVGSLLFGERRFEA